MSLLDTHHCIDFYEKCTECGGHFCTLHEPDHVQVCLDQYEEDRRRDAEEWEDEEDDYDD